MDEPAPAPTDPHPQRPFPNPEHDLSPRVPRTLGGAVYLTVLATVMGSLAVIGFGQWQIGLILMGAAFGAAGAARLVLPDRQGGMLHLRRKFVDVLTLFFFAVALITLAAVIPPTV